MPLVKPASVFKVADVSGIKWGLTLSLDNAKRVIEELKRSYRQEIYCSKDSAQKSEKRRERIISDLRAIQIQLSLIERALSAFNQEVEVIEDDT